MLFRSGLVFDEVVSRSSVDEYLSRQNIVDDRKVDQRLGLQKVECPVLDFRLAFEFEIGRASCREKSVSVRVALGGRRRHKKQESLCNIRSEISLIIIALA